MMKIIKFLLALVVGLKDKIKELNYELKLKEKEVNELKEEVISDDVWKVDKVKVNRNKDSKKKADFFVLPGSDDLSLKFSLMESKDGDSLYVINQLRNLKDVCGHWVNCEIKGQNWKVSSKIVGDIEGYIIDSWKKWKGEYEEKQLNLNRGHNPDCSSCFYCTKKNIGHESDSGKIESKVHYCVLKEEALDEELIDIYNSELERGDIIELNKRNDRVMVRENRFGIKIFRPKNFFKENKLGLCRHYCGKLKDKIYSLRSGYTYWESEWTARLPISKKEELFLDFSILDEMDPKDSSNKNKEKINQKDECNKESSKDDDNKDNDSGPTEGYVYIENENGERVEVREKEYYVEYLNPLNEVVDRKKFSCLKDHLETFVLNTMKHEGYYKAVIFMYPIGFDYEFEPNKDRKQYNKQRVDTIINPDYDPDPEGGDFEEESFDEAYMGSTNVNFDDVAFDDNQPVNSEADIIITEEDEGMVALNSSGVKICTGQSVKDVKNQLKDSNIEGETEVRVTNNNNKEDDSMTIRPTAVDSLIEPSNITKEHVDNAKTIKQNLKEGDDNMKEFVNIEELIEIDGVGEGTIKKLKDAGIDKVYGVETEEFYTDIKGIGSKTAQKIQDVVLDMFEDDKKEVGSEEEIIEQAGEVAVSKEPVDPFKEVYNVETGETVILEYDEGLDVDISFKVDGEFEADWIKDSRVTNCSVEIKVNNNVAKASVVNKDDEWVLDCTFEDGEMTNDKLSSLLKRDVDKYPFTALTETVLERWFFILAHLNIDRLDGEDNTKNKTNKKESGSMSINIGDKVKVAHNGFVGEVTEVTNKDPKVFKVKNGNDKTFAPADKVELVNRNAANDDNNNTDVSDDDGDETQNNKEESGNMIGNKVRLVHNDFVGVVTELTNKEKEVYKVENDQTKRFAPISKIKVLEEGDDDVTTDSKGQANDSKGQRSDDQTDENILLEGSITSIVGNYTYKKVEVRECEEYEDVKLIGRITAENGNYVRFYKTNDGQVKKSFSFTKSRVLESKLSRLVDHLLDKAEEQLDS